MFKKIKAFMKKYPSVFNKFTFAVLAVILLAPMTDAHATSAGWSDWAGALDSSDAGATVGVDTTWPWTRFLNSLARELTGPLPMVLGIMGIVACAAGMMLGNHGAGMQKLMALVFGISICLFAPGLIYYMEAGVGGLTIAGL